MGFEHVQAHRPGQVSWVEDDHVMHPRRRNALQHVLNQIAVRINDAYPLAAGDILDRHVSHQVRFADAGCSDHVDVAAPVAGLYFNYQVLTAIDVMPEDDALGRQGDRRRSLLGGQPGDVRRLHRGERKVIKTVYFFAVEHHHGRIKIPPDGIPNYRPSFTDPAPFKRGAGFRSMELGKSVDDVFQVHSDVTLIR